MRRVLLTLFAVLTVSAGRAEAVTLRDLIELSKAGLGEQVLLALIEVDRPIFSIDAATLKQLKQAGISDTVIAAVIRSGRTPLPEPAVAPVPESAPEPREPQVVVIDHHDSPAAAPVAYPVAVPVVGVYPTPRFENRGVPTILNTDQGLVKARVPVPANCVTAQPVYWGFGGQLRPGSWAPPPTVVCGR